MSFFRHGEIYRPKDVENVPGRSGHDRPRPHRYDEFPAGYSSAGCAPAEPASASPAEAHLAGFASGSTIDLQQTVNRLLTPCLTQGDNPRMIILICEIASSRTHDSYFRSAVQKLCKRSTQGNHEKDNVSESRA
jgi:hypothetical protein